MIEKSTCDAPIFGKRKVDYLIMTKMIHNDKTIPYRLSPAELENLRILRRKIKPFDASVDDDEADEFREGGNKNSDTVPVNKTPGKKV